MAKPIPCLSEGGFCPKKPMAEVNPRRHQALYSLVLIPGPFASNQHPPIHSPSASEATESKEVSKCGTILHSSGLFCLGCFVFFHPFFIIAPLPLLKGWQNYSCLLAREKCLTRYCQFHSQNSTVFSGRARKSC